jgi:hypothetical protein
MAQLLFFNREDSLRVEHEGAQDRKADALGWLGEVPDLVQVFPLLSRAEGHEKVRGRDAILTRPAGPLP